MRKTLFAGLTVLDADESVVEDAGAFIGRDRDTIDRYLELGAVTHRHNAAAGLSNPIGAPSASTLPSGGTLAADSTFSVGYTLQDSTGGETVLSPIVTVATPPTLDEPTNDITGAASYVAGNLQVDTYYYAISYTDAEGGETPIGPATAVERAPGYASGQVLLTGLDDGIAAASAAGWRLYRSIGGGDFGFLAEGTGDSFTDDGSVGADCQVTPVPDDVNTTLSISRLQVDLPPDVDDADFINIYVSEDGSFEGDVFLEQFPRSSAGQSVIYTELDLSDGMPPDVSTSVGGAHKIDPDTEILDWHWKRPVASPGVLPSGEYGDVRLALSDGTMWGMLTAPSGNHADWRELGASAALAVSDDDENDAAVTKLVFHGSGETQVEMEDLGGGSARIIIYAPTDTETSGGGGPSVFATDADGPRLGPLSQLNFAASGSATVGVTDLGGGSAQVTIFASAAKGDKGDTGATGAKGDTGDPGPAGAPGAGGASHRIAGSAHAAGYTNDSGYTEYRASGVVQAAVESLGTGSAAVTIASLGRAWASATAVALASGASASIDFTGSAAGLHILKVSTNKRARVRVYGDAAARTADLARALGTDPTGDHGVALDYAATPTASGGVYRINPVVDTYNLDAPPLNKLYLNITNYDATGDVVVALLYVPTEVV